MRILMIVSLLGLLTGCAGVLDYCPDSLRDPLPGSGVPNLHKGP